MSPRELAIAEMRRRRKSHAVYGLRFSNREELAETENQVKCFDSFDDMMAWCDTLLSIYEDDRPTVVCAVHNI